MPEKENFGNKLRAWRKRRGWLQKQAADALSVSLDTYRAWEYNNGAPHKAPSRAEIEQRMEAAK
jgi:transcriptional regulator with XRE-family HTH domain